MRWLFPAYLVLIGVVSFIIDNITKKRALKKNKEEHPDKFLKKLLKKLSEAFTVLILVFTGIFFLIASFWIDEYYLIFTRKRTTEIESKFGIVVDENVNLEKYSKSFGGPDGANIVLRFEIKITPDEFIENNINGTVIQKINENELENQEKIYIAYKVEEENGYKSTFSGYFEKESNGTYSVVLRW